MASLTAYHGTKAEFLLTQEVKQVCLKLFEIVSLLNLDVFYGFLYWWIDVLKDLYRQLVKAYVFLSSFCVAGHGQVHNGLTVLF